ncbi:unnamed protein product [Trichogramma brassicae]|uniref:Reverse transcriptase domain-containing protein n=1 Tax=Trichogramma brassicae TaxID=86971 RepID=A0A6H5IB73_9HYME|nr:unnamed protein product [Trichogramma brassicae]
MFNKETRGVGPIICEIVVKLFFVVEVSAPSRKRCVREYFNRKIKHIDWLFKFSNTINMWRHRPRRRYYIVISRKRHEIQLHTFCWKNIDDLDRVHRQLSVSSDSKLLDEDSREETKVILRPRRLQRPKSEVFIGDSLPKRNKRFSAFGVSTFILLHDRESKRTRQLRPMGSDDIELNEKRNYKNEDLPKIDMTLTTLTRRPPQLRIMDLLQKIFGVSCAPHTTFCSSSTAVTSSITTARASTMIFSSQSAGVGLSRQIRPEPQLDPRFAALSQDAKLDKLYEAISFVAAQNRDLQSTMNNLTTMIGEHETRLNDLENNLSRAYVEIEKLRTHIDQMSYCSRQQTTEFTVSGIPSSLPESENDQVVGTVLTCIGAQRFLSDITRVRRLKPKDASSEFRTLLVVCKSPFRRPSAPWMTDVLRGECRVRDRLFREAIRLGSVDLMRRYRIFRRDLKERISRARVDYLSRSLEEQPDQAAVWRLLERHGVTASRASSAVGRFTLAELNDYYRGVASVHQPCTRDQLTAVMEHTPIKVESRFSFSQVTATEINRVYGDVRRRSRGRSSDGLPLQYLDHIWTVLLPYLVRLFNSCLSSGVYPDAWKRAFIVPLNKIASPASPADTRPIVNLPHLAKIFDRLFTRQMLDYIESNELLLPNQFGFRSGHSTQHALLHLTDIIRLGIEKGLVTLLMLFDLPCRHSKHHLYADDFTIFSSGPASEAEAIISRVNEDLACISAWSVDNGLSINVRKTQAAWIGSRSFIARMRSVPTSPLILDGEPINLRDNIKLLGVVLDETLSWRAQVTAAANRCFAALAHLRRHRDCLPQETRLMLVRSLVFPHLDYGAGLLADLSGELTTRMERCMNAALCFVTGVSRFDHITPSYVACGLLKYRRCRDYLALSLLASTLRRGGPAYLADRLSFVRRDALGSLRRSHLELKIPWAATSCLQSAFFVHTARLWNDLPRDLLARYRNETFRTYLYDHMLG